MTGEIGANMVLKRSALVRNELRWLWDCVEYGSWPYSSEVLNHVLIF